MGTKRLKELVSVFLLSTLLPLVDVGTDCYTGISLIVEKNFVGGALVLLFMWTPCILYFLNKKFIPRDVSNFQFLLPTKKIVVRSVAKVILWPAYHLVIIFKTFFYFYIGHHTEFDQRQEVEEIKVGATGFESVPQAILQLSLAFSDAKYGPHSGITADRVIKVVSIVSSIISLTLASFDIISKRNIINEGERVPFGNEVFRFLYTFSTITASLMLWATLAFILEAWVALAFICSYCLTYIILFLVLKQQDRFSKGISDWLGSPPFYWVTAYVIGFCLPNKEKGASIFGSVVTLAIFTTLVQKCVIQVDFNKAKTILHSDSTISNAANSTGSCRFDDLSEDTILLWAPFTFFFIWLFVSVWILMSIRVTTFLHFLQTIFAIGLVAGIFVLIL